MWDRCAGDSTFSLCVQVTLAEAREWKIDNGFRPSVPKSKRAHAYCLFDSRLDLFARGRVLRFLQQGSWLFILCSIGKAVA